ncbi:hypothetical protein Q7C36_011251 [Tachysurus vachellii]|uniref:Uncharacterized protein n=1 Tax=Tachysurus vachellii TaxID=175792 RepID=A0AA88MQV4_TACVA|nr:hypothetical protein Q7C36_011251 [Tachysurus vachellii]
MLHRVCQDGSYGMSDRCGLNLCERNDEPSAVPPCPPAPEAPRERPTAGRGTFMHQSDRWRSGDGALQSASRLALASSCSTIEEMRDRRHGRAGTRTGGFFNPVSSCCPACLWNLLHDKSRVAPPSHDLLHLLLVILLTSNRLPGRPERGGREQINTSC